MVVVVVRVRERTIGVAGVGIESVAEEHCADSELNPAIPFILRSCSLNCELGGGDFGFSAGLSHPPSKKAFGAKGNRRPESSFSISLAIFLNF